MTDKVNDIELCKASENGILALTPVPRGPVLYPFLDFPGEIKHRILSFCSFYSILVLNVASKDFWKSIGTSDDVWEIAFKNQWPRLVRRNKGENRDDGSDETVTPEQSPHSTPSGDSSNSSRSTAWRQAFKERWIVTGGKPEDNSIEDWADFDFMLTAADEREKKCTEGEKRASVLRDFNKYLRPQNCECKLIGKLSETCWMKELMPHLYICQRSGMSHYCTVSNGIPCAMSIEATDNRGTYICEVTGSVSTLVTEEADGPLPTDEYETVNDLNEDMNDDMEPKQLLEREYERGYSMTEEEAVMYFGMDGALRTTLLDNPNFRDERCSRKRRRSEED